MNSGATVLVSSSYHGISEVISHLGYPRDFVGLPVTIEKQNNSTTSRARRQSPSNHRKLAMIRQYDTYRALGSVAYCLIRQLALQASYSLSTTTTAEKGLPADQRKTQQRVSYDGSQ